MANLTTEQLDEYFRICDSLDTFVEYMKTKLYEGVVEGKKGWDDPACLNPINRRLFMDAMYLHYDIQDHDEGREINIANFAFMHFMLRRVQSVEPHEQVVIEIPLPIKTPENKDE